MKCPKCQKDMVFVEMHKTYREDGREYNRAIYQCEQDDIWITIEVPTEKHLA